MKYLLPSAINSYDWQAHSEVIITIVHHDLQCHMFAVNSYEPVEEAVQPWHRTYSQWQTSYCILYLWWNAHLQMLEFEHHFALCSLHTFGWFFHNLKSCWWQLYFSAGYGLVGSTLCLPSVCRINYNCIISFSYWCLVLPLSVTGIAIWTSFEMVVKKKIKKNGCIQIENIKNMSIENLANIKRDIMIIYHACCIVYCLSVKLVSCGSVRSCDFSRLQGVKITASD